VTVGGVFPSLNPEWFSVLTLPEWAMKWYRGDYQSISVTNEIIPVCKVISIYQRSKIRKSSLSPSTKNFTDNRQGFWVEQFESVSNYGIKYIRANFKTIRADFEKRLDLESIATIS
jgi:hypothetical protein